MKYILYQPTAAKHVLDNIQRSFTFGQFHSLPRSVSALLSLGSSLGDDVTSSNSGVKGNPATGASDPVTAV
jgi:hypothetical protein